MPDIFEQARKVFKTKKTKKTKISGKQIQILTQLGLLEVRGKKLKFRSPENLDKTLKSEFWNDVPNVKATIKAIKEEAKEQNLIIFGSLARKYNINCSNIAVDRRELNALKLLFRYLETIFNWRILFIFKERIWLVKTLESLNKEEIEGILLDGGDRIILIPNSAEKKYKKLNSLARFLTNILKVDFEIDGKVTGSHIAALICGGGRDLLDDIIAEIRLRLLHIKNEELAKLGILFYMNKLEKESGREDEKKFVQNIIDILTEKGIKLNKIRYEQEKEQEQPKISLSGYRDILRKLGPKNLYLGLLSMLIDREIDLHRYVEILAMVLLGEFSFAVFSDYSAEFFNDLFKNLTTRKVYVKDIVRMLIEAENCCPSAVNIKRLLGRSLRRVDIHRQEEVFKEEILRIIAMDPERFKKLSLLGFAIYIINYLPVEQHYEFFKAVGSSILGRILFIDPSETIFMAHEIKSIMKVSIKGMLPVLLGFCILALENDPKILFLLSEELVKRQLCTYREIFQTLVVMDVENDVSLYVTSIKALSDPNIANLMDEILSYLNVSAKSIIALLKWELDKPLDYSLVRLLDDTANQLESIGVLSSARIARDLIRLIDFALSEVPPNLDDLLVYYSRFVESSIIIENLPKRILESRLLVQIQDEMNKKYQQFSELWKNELWKEYLASKNHLYIGKNSYTVANTLNIIRRLKEMGYTAVILLVIDGLRYDSFQKVIKPRLEKLGFKVLDETPVISLLPSITQYSRTSIFNGAPINFIKELGTPKIGLPSEIYLIKKRFRNSYYINKPALHDLELWLPSFDPNKITFLAVVVQSLEKVQHGAVEGTAAYVPIEFANRLTKIIELIAEKYKEVGKRVLLAVTADHGLMKNVEKDIEINLTKDKRLLELGLSTEKPVPMLHDRYLLLPFVKRKEGSEGEEYEPIEEVSEEKIAKIFESDGINVFVARCDRLKIKYVHLPETPEIRKDRPLLNLPGSAVYIVFPKDNIRFIKEGDEKAKRRTVIHGALAPDETIIPLAFFEF